jgi:hypothetical protein
MLSTFLKNKKNVGHMRQIKSKCPLHCDQKVINDLCLIAFNYIRVQEILNYKLL